MGAELEESGRPSRLACLDVARFAAIVLMVFAHFTDALVRPSEWESDFGQVYRHVRGITAPLFLLVSGWAFSLATLPRFQEHKRLTASVKARLRRAGVLALWGSALTLPWWAEGFPFAARSDVWAPFFTFGVLHCIAVALVLGLALLRVSPTPAVFSGLSLVVAALSSVAAPAVQAWAAPLPSVLRGALFAGSFAGGFPLFPWVGYFFFGACIGTVAWLRGAPALVIAKWTAVLSVILFCAGAALLPAGHAWFGGGLRGTALPLILQRLAIACLVVAVFARCITRWTPALKVFAVLSAHALTFYVGHMLMLWGVPLSAGLHHRVGQTLSFPAVGALTAASLVLLGALIRAGGRAPSRLKPLESPARVERSWAVGVLDAESICISTQALTVNGHSYHLSRIASIEAESRGPRFVAALTLLTLGVVGIPAAIALNKVMLGAYVWVVSFPVTFILGAGFAVLTAKAKYCVVLRGAHGEVQIFKSTDHQAAIQLVAALREAISHTRRSTVA